MKKGNQKLFEESKISLKKEFPFENYIKSKFKSVNKGSYYDAVRIATNYLDKGDKILDFGAGACDKTALLKFMGFECSAYDDLNDDWHKIDDNREKILNFTKNVGIDFKLAEQYEKLPFDNGSFDMVMLSHVIEHFHNSPRETLNDLVELLKPGGILYIAVPSAVNIRKRIQVLRGKTNYGDFDHYFWYPDPYRDHVREYVKDDLKKLAKNLNMEVLELKGRDHMTARLSRKIQPLYLAITKFFPAWKDSWILVAKKPKDWEPIRNLPKDEFNKLMNKTTSYKYE
jgi:SAM-dependent methyltransferase